MSEPAPIIAPPDPRDVSDGTQLMLVDVGWPVYRYPTDEELIPTLIRAAEIVTHSRRRPLFPPKGMDFDDFRQEMRLRALPKVRKFRMDPTVNERRRLAGKKPITLDSYCFLACWHAAVDILRAHRSAMPADGPRTFPLLDYIDQYGGNSGDEEPEGIS